MNDIKQFDTGAVRSSDADNVRFDLITPIGLRRLAETYAEGAKKYSDNNWLKGIPSTDLFNHAVRLVIRLTGIRRGFAGKRFPRRTREQFLANEAFINSAYPHDPRAE